MTVVAVRRHAERGSVEGVGGGVPFPANRGTQNNQLDCFRWEFCNITKRNSFNSDV